MTVEDPEVELDMLEERAALIAEGEGCTKQTAEYTAAQQFGYRNWMDARLKIKARIRERDEESRQKA